MRGLKQASLYLILLLVISSNSFGQETAPMVAVSEVIKHVGEAGALYDRRENITTARVYIPKVYEKQNVLYDMGALFRVPGKGSFKPDVVYIHFNSSLWSKEEKLKEPKLNIKVDNEKWLDLGDVRLLQPTAYGWGTSIAKVDFQTFTRLASAKKVQAQLGKARFDLSPSHFEALRDLIKIIEPNTRGF
jgi:hypothetical protein